MKKEKKKKIQRIARHEEVGVHLAEKI